MITLAPPLDAYFAAVNHHDEAAMLACFADDARVHDEHKDIVGHAAIAAWIAETTQKYRVTAMPTEIETTGDRSIVIARVAGNFPGSPAALRYEFTVADDRVTALRIG